MRTLCFCLLALGSTAALAADAPPQKKQRSKLRKRARPPAGVTQRPGSPSVGIGPPDEPAQKQVSPQLDGTIEPPRTSTRDKHGAPSIEPPKP